MTTKTNAPEPTTEDSARAIVAAWITQPPWMLAELRRRMKLRARFYEMRRAIWAGKL